MYEPGPRIKYLVYIRFKIGGPKKIAILFPGVCQYLRIYELICWLFLKWVVLKNK